MKRWLKWGLIVLGIILVLLLVVCIIRRGPLSVGLRNSEITNFQECIDAGNPAMESYPRQCRDPIGDRTFTEVIDTSNLPPPPMPPSVPGLEK